MNAKTLFKQVVGQNIEELARTPSLDELVGSYLKKASSPYPLVTLGTSDTEILEITEGERESHIHVVGAPGSGKSKFLEYLIRHDIDRLHKKEKGACGLCFLDPSVNGGTLRKVLSYCAKINFRQVIYIDPHTLQKHGKMPAINPFDAYRTFWSASTESLVDAFRVLFEVQDPSRQSYIETYLTALFSLFHYTNLTPHDLVHFTDPLDRSIPELVYMDEMRQRIFEHVREVIYAKDFPLTQIAGKHLADVERAYKNIPNFKDEVGSTARRLNPLVTNEYLMHLFGHRKGLDFDKLISEGWVILVNVSPGRGLGTFASRLLATVIINQLVSTIERLQNKGRNIPYYLYIDEAGQYVTRKLADMVSYKRQVGMRVVLAHQYLGQLKDPLIKEAILNCTDIKCAFRIAGSEERKAVTKMLGYGGDLDPEKVSFNLNSQKKQEMVVRLSKQTPKLIRVPDVPDADGDVEGFITELVKDPIYYTRGQILEDEQSRLQTKNTQGSHSRKASDRASTGKTDVPPGFSGEPEKDVPPRDEKSGKNGRRRPLGI
jgi:hypothetical protein